MTITKTKPTCPLRDDRSAAPPMLRAADYGGRRGALVVSEGLVSDHYSMLPASSVAIDTKHGTAADLEPGVYRVEKLNAVPERVRDDAPNMVPLIPDGTLVDLKPFTVDGLGHVHVVNRDPISHEVTSTCAVFESAAGVRVAINVEILPDAGAEHDSVALPAYQLRDAPVRWTLQTRDTSTGQAPCLFTRRAYRTVTKANGSGRDVACSGEWQAVIMPVRLGAR